MSFLINPFAFAVAGGDFESIATVTVGSGGAANIDFTSISASYQHLQLRGISKSTSTGADSQWFYMQLNSDTASNYNSHQLYGTGASAVATNNASDAIRLGGSVRSSAASQMFTTHVIDILDYANTSKNTTVRSFSGWDTNNTTTGVVWHSSGLWRSTSAVTSIRLGIVVENFTQHSTFALYGIKAP